MDSLALDFRYPNLPTSPEQCVTCRGDKTFRWYSADRSQLVDYTCPCADQFVLHRVLLHHGIALSYQRLGWADLVDFLPAEPHALADEYLVNQRYYFDAGVGMVLHGTRGTGKTLLAHLILKGLIESGVDCYVSGFEDMVQTFADGWRDKDLALWFRQRVSNADVLLIDDLGRERSRGSGAFGEVPERLLESVVRYRVSQLKPTFITTNSDPDKLALGYGGMVMSLLSERAVMCEFQGSDRRKQMRDRTLSEARLRLTRPVTLT